MAKPVAVWCVAIRLADAAEVLDLALVDRVAGRRVQHAVAGVHDHLQELADHRLAARLHGDVVGAVARGHGASTTSSASASRSGAMPAAAQ